VLKVGIPRALAYYSYYPLWETFFTEIGAQIVVSEPTNKDILNAGVKDTVNDACVPIKIYHGHVASLREKVDYLFIPRLVNINRLTTFCPKFLGLPEMIRSSMDGLPPIIDVRVDLRRGRYELFKICCRVGRIFTRNYWRILQAYRKALTVFRRFKGLLEQGFTPENAIEIIYHPEKNAASPPSPLVRQLRLALLGYPYEIYDQYVSVDVVGKLKAMGVSVITADMIPARQLMRQAGKIAKTLFWTYSDQAIKAAYHFFEKRDIDGIIHVTAFGCGPDSMVDKLIEIEARGRRGVPYLSLMIDEQTAEAGLMTRLEAFVDMLRLRRRLDEHNIPVSR
jgi:predicted nucleotide-binding protein (sugar kinase/HSP70/actin superfamily)